MAFRVQRRHTHRKCHSGTTTPLPNARGQAELREKSDTAAGLVPDSETAEQPDRGVNGSTTVGKTAPGEKCSNPGASKPRVNQPDQKDVTSSSFCDLQWTRDRLPKLETIIPSNQSSNTTVSKPSQCSHRPVRTDKFLARPAKTPHTRGISAIDTPRTVKETPGISANSYKVSINEHVISQTNPSSSNLKLIKQKTNAPREEMTTTKGPASPKNKQVVSKEKPFQSRGSATIKKTLDVSSAKELGSAVESSTRQSKKWCDISPESSTRKQRSPCNASKIRCKGSTRVKSSTPTTILASPQIEVRGSLVGNTRHQNDGTEQILSTAQEQNEPGPYGKLSPQVVSISRCSTLDSELTTHKQSAHKQVRSFSKKGLMIDTLGSKTSLDLPTPSNAAKSGTSHFTPDIKKCNFPCEEYETISLSSSIAEILQGRAGGESQMTFCSRKHGSVTDVSRLSLRASSRLKRNESDSGGKSRRHQYALSDDEETISAPQNANRRDGVMMVPPRLPTDDTMDNLNEMLIHGIPVSTAVPEKKRRSRKTLTMNRKDVGHSVLLEAHRLSSTLLNSQSASPRNAINIHSNILKSPKPKSVISLMLDNSICSDHETLSQFQRLNLVGDSSPEVEGHLLEEIPAAAIEEATLVPTPDKKMARRTGSETRLGRREEKLAATETKDRKRNHTALLSMSVDALSPPVSVNHGSTASPNEETGIVLSLRPALCHSPKPCFSPQNMNIGSPENRGFQRRAKKTAQGGKETELADRAPNLTEAFDKLLSIMGEPGHREKLMSIKHWLETNSYSKLSVKESDAPSLGGLSQNVVSFKSEISSVSVEAPCRGRVYPSATKEVHDITDGSPAMQNPRTSRRRGVSPRGQKASPSLSPQARSPVSNLFTNVEKQASRSLGSSSRWRLGSPTLVGETKYGKFRCRENTTTPGSPKTVAAMTAAGHKPYCYRKIPKPSANFRKHKDMERRRGFWGRCLVASCVLLLTFECIALGVAFLWKESLLSPWALTNGGHAVNTAAPVQGDNSLQKPSETI